MLEPLLEPEIHRTGPTSSAAEGIAARSGPANCHYCRDLNSAGTFHLDAGSARLLLTTALEDVDGEANKELLSERQLVAVCPRSGNVHLLAPFPLKRQRGTSKAALNTRKEHIIAERDRDLSPLWPPSVRRDNQRGERGIISES